MMSRGTERLLTEVLFHVELEDLDVFVLIEPLVDVEVEVAAVADGFTLYNLHIAANSRGGLGSSSTSQAKLSLSLPSLKGWELHDAIDNFFLGKV